VIESARYELVLCSAWVGRTKWYTVVRQPED